MVCIHCGKTVPEYDYCASCGWSKHTQRPVSGWFHDQEVAFEPYNCGGAMEPIGKGVWKCQKCGYETSQAEVIWSERADVRKQKGEVNPNG